MRLALIVMLLISSCCGYTEQEDHGWVEKPKRAVMERWNAKAKRFDTLWHRYYHMSGSRLDSVVDIREHARTVYSRFSHALTNQRVVPWDFSLSAVFHTQYGADGKGGWILAGTRYDSIHGDRVVATTLKEIDSAGNWSVYHQTWDEYDSLGRHVASLTLSTNKILYGDRYLYERSSDGRVLRVTKQELNDTVEFRIFQRIDTERVTYYKYDPDGRLIEVLDTSGLDGAYPNPTFTRIWDFTLHDTMAMFSIEAIPNFFVIGPSARMMKTGMYRLEMRGESKENHISSQLDDRHRLVNLKTSSSESSASYYNDNTIKETRLVSNGKLFTHARTIRKYDDKKRAVVQESQEFDEEKDDFVATSRVHYFY